MGVFELLFVCIAAGNCAVCIAAATGFRTNRRRSLRLLQVAIVFDAVYMAVVVGVSLTAPPRLVHIGRPQCFDDWCMSVDGFDEADSATDRTFLVRLTVRSRARNRPQREGSLDLYVVDERNRSYPALPDLGDPLPQDIVLQPGQAVSTVCLFRLPRSARSARMIIGHYGPGCMVIGEDCDRLNPRFFPLR